MKTQNGEGDPRAIKQIAEQNDALLMAANDYIMFADVDHLRGFLIAMVQFWDDEDIFPMESVDYREIVILYGFLEQISGAIAPASESANT